MKPMKSIKQTLLKLMIGVLAFQTTGVMTAFANEGSDGNDQPSGDVAGEEEVSSQETSPETSDEETGYTRDQALAYIEDHDLVTQTRDALLQEGLVSSNQLDQLPSDAILETLVTYLMNYGEELVPTNFFNLLTTSYPTYFNEAPSTMTEEEAQAYIEENNLLERAPALLIEHGLATQAQLDQLPQDAIQQALIRQFTTVPMGGDVGVLYQILVEMYPDIFSDQVSDNDSQSNADYPRLEFNQEVELDQKIFNIRRAFVLRPGEAGNQSTDTYLLGIEYSYTNESDQAEDDYQDVWQAHTQFTQLEADQNQVLVQGSYEFQGTEGQNATSQVQIMDNEEPLQPGDSTRQTVFYELVNTVEPVVFTARGRSSDEVYQIDTQEKLKLPPQSGVYYNETNTLAAYLFDFDTLYIVFTEDATLSQINTINGEADLVSESSLSPEAQEQFQILNQATGDAQLQLLEFKDIYYELSDLVVGVRQIEEVDGQVSLSNILATLRGEPESQSLVNQVGDRFILLTE